MTWYRIGTVTVTNGSPVVTLAGGDALQNIFPNDGFVGPDGRTYGILSIGGANTFTLQTNYLGPTLAGAAYGVIPVADYEQLRTLITSVNSLITQYQDITLKAGAGRFTPGTAAAPGVKGIGFEGTGLVWNGDGGLSITVNGTIAATFAPGGAATISFPDGTVGTPGVRFANDTDTGIFRPGANALGMAVGGVEMSRVTSTGMGVGMTAPRVKFTISGAAGAPVLNAASGVFELVLDVTTVLAMGGSFAGPYALWLQGKQYNVEYTSTPFPVAINPLGGNVGVGKLDPTVAFHVKSSGEIARFETTAARGSGNGLISFADPTGRKGYLGYGGPSDAFYLINDMNANMNFGTNGISRWGISSNGHLYPISDSSYSIGFAGNRPNQIYAVSGTINTSDAEEKTWRGAPTPAELAAAKRIIAELGFYQWNDAITVKGPEGARIHFGVRAQEVWAIMADEGLVDPIVEGVTPSSSYAFLCYDEWEEEVRPVLAWRRKVAPAPIEGEPVAPVEPLEPVWEDCAQGDEGAEAYATGATEVVRPAGHLFGIRPDQLTMFLVAAQEARLAALEALITP